MGKFICNIGKKISFFLRRQLISIGEFHNHSTLGIVFILSAYTMFVYYKNDLNLELVICFIILYFIVCWSRVVFDYIFESSEKRKHFFDFGNQYFTFFLFIFLTISSVAVLHFISSRIELPLTLSKIIDGNTKYIILIGVFGSFASIIGVYLASRIYKETDSDTGRLKSSLSRIEDALRKNPIGISEVSNSLDEYFIDIIKNIENRSNQPSKKKGKFFILSDTFPVGDIYTKYTPMNEEHNLGKKYTNINKNIEIIANTSLEVRFASLDTIDERIEDVNKFKITESRYEYIKTVSLFKYLISYVSANKLLKENKTEWYDIPHKKRETELINTIKSIEANKDHHKKDIIDIAKILNSTFDKKQDLVTQLELDIEFNISEEKDSKKGKKDWYQYKTITNLIDIPFQAFIYIDSDSHIYRAMIIHNGSYNKEHIGKPTALITYNKDLVLAYHSIVEDFILEQDGVILLPKLRNLNLTKPITLLFDDDRHKEISIKDINNVFNKINIEDQIKKTFNEYNSDELFCWIALFIKEPKEEGKFIRIDTRHNPNNWIKTFKDKLVKLFRSESDTDEELLRIVYDIAKGGILVGKIKLASEVLEVVQNTSGDKFDKDIEIYCLAVTEKEYLMDNCSIRFGHLINDVRRIFELKKIERK